MKKKILPLLLVTLLSFSLAACGKNSDNKESSDESTVTSESQVTEESVVTEEPSALVENETSEESEASTEEADNDTESVEGNDEGSSDSEVFTYAGEQGGGSYYTAEDGSIFMVLPYGDAIDSATVEAFNSKSDIITTAFDAIFKSMLEQMTGSSVSTGESGFRDVNGKTVFYFEATMDGQDFVGYLTVTEESSYVLVGLSQGADVVAAMDSMLEEL